MAENALGKVMVIGGGGWVGSALALELLRRREELGVAHVVVADLPDASKLKWLRQQAEAKGAGALLMERVLNVAKPKEVQQLLGHEKPQTIFNLAAVIEMRPEVSEASMTAVNTKAVEFLLKEITCERLVHFSTFDAAWGGNCLQAAPKPPEDLQIESPIGYVRSKARGELQIHLWMAKMAHSRKVATVVLRPGHIFGALEDLDVMAADALAGFLRKFPPVQLGPANATMSLVSVPTVVEAAVRAAQNAQKVSGRCFAVKDLDANFFRFYHESVLGRRIWPLRVPGFVLFFAALVEDFVYWLTLEVALVHWLPSAILSSMMRRLSKVWETIAASAGENGDLKSSELCQDLFDPKKWALWICPSTTCMRQHNLSVMGPRPTGDLARRLQVLSYEAQLLLEVAATLADKVVVVTNAEEGWVNLSCRAWLPELLETLEKCEVASARSQFEPTGISSPAGWKARAFEEVIERFYQRYPNQSWKNIISIGDAPHEREALARVVRGAPIFRGKRCRSKSIKFVLRPNIEQLVRELQMLRDSLREIVLHDDDLDMHFCTETFADPLQC
ncbi:unnamed protein product [Cladocopium goreaui]|uniref:NAD-dependent epimerase/dehydratase domain-containing protein n=1 Tax=Cladocopium goreaui TaxID=2562237 RepID=A0A9P1GKI3_9DINO|nr:unnamed protein product [Cladocopium goreaui]